MSKVTFKDVKLYAEHEPDVEVKPHTGGRVPEGELPGHVVVGVVLNGVKRPLYRFKAAGLLADIAQAKSGKAGAADTTTDEE